MTKKYKTIKISNIRFHHKGGIQHSQLPLYSLEHPIIFKLGDRYKLVKIPDKEEKT